MAIYKFRVTYEDHDDVYRDIEIKSGQTFEDFHNAIQKAIGFDNAHPASFYISDDYWRKGMEITLRKEDAGDGKSKKLMAKSKLAGFIEDPHQKMVYVFDFKVQWTFLIELTKINLGEPNGEFPKCVKSSGTAPKQYKKTILPPPDEEDDDVPDKNAKEKIFISEEAYDKPDEDDDVLLESEEDTGQSEESAESEDSENFEEN